MSEYDHQHESWLETTVERLTADLAAARAERDEYRAARIAYASEFPPDEEGHPDTGNVHANIRALKAERDGLAKALDLFLNRPPGASYNDLVERARAALAALPKTPKEEESCGESL